ncbi:MAG: KH domain-containing protein [Candidatus Syntropharchaeia archaeon]
MMGPIKIPQDRIGVLIGVDGSVKKLIEEKTRTRIEIDSENGNVLIESSEDPLGALRAVEVVRAIGRGFSPEKALKLFEDDELCFEIIDLSFATPKQLRRIRGRVIGREGKARRVIETLTGSKISVYGKTIGIIGYPEQIKIARTAINMLINGSPHGAVYSFLEKKKREEKEKTFM